MFKEHFFCPKKAKALHNLICSVLRGPHIRDLTLDELQSFTYKVGRALHNIPFYLAKGEEVEESILIEIDQLDPSSTKEDWGHWVKIFCAEFSQAIPAIEVRISSR
ncbi:hypothetical protein [Microbulbifer sp. THAF38]|uniref:hypothetical protein n=1 Tax=Microbulbifer sp. THAF38 TaxID=2587856 RepID=UPI001268DC7A|nr:hypothetical protein [Microbulbifer sp. THAF38]QFT57089.1 hypothetical protein FIU95_21290 [Microbulbifer sp. THAF38]